MNKEYLLHYFIDQMIDNYQLASLQLVLHKKKNACNITVEINPKYKLKFKLKTIQYKSFIWSFSKIGPNNFAVFVHNNKLHLLNDKIKNTLLSFGIKTKINANRDFDFLVKKITYSRKYFKNRSLRQTIIDNVIMGHCYSYPIRNIKDFITYNYLNNPKGLPRKGLFFFTNNDQCGIMSYRTKCDYFHKLKKDYISICKKKNVKVNFKSTHKNFYIK